MRIAYLDVFAGISGDMTLGALLDAGVSVDALRAELLKIPMHGWALDAVKAKKQGIAGTQAKVTQTSAHHHHHDPKPEHENDHSHEHEHDHGHEHSHEHEDAHSHGHEHNHEPAPPAHKHEHGRSCQELVDLIEASTLEREIIEKSTSILWRIAKVEAQIHASTPEQVHFHEIGGLDSIIDIVGAVVGFKMLGVDEILCSPLPVSHGFIDCAHGRLPVPAPATLALMQGVPTFSLDVDGETVTPTGAAIAVGLADRITNFPSMTVERIGYGCGNKDFPGVPNVLRLVVGERSGERMPGVEGGETTGDALVTDTVRLIEANIDDMNPEYYTNAMQRIFAAGAVDVWLTPIIMKKGRPAVTLSALTSADNQEAVIEAILRETTTFGVRIANYERRCLARERVTVDTPFGIIHVKLGRLNGKVITASPEHDDCLKAAETHNVSLKDVYAAAQKCIKIDS